jgi:PKHD-type hydroxylase
MLYNWYFYKQVYTKEQCAEIIDVAKQHRSDFYADRPAPGKKVDTFIIPTNLMFDKLTPFFSLVEQANEECFGLDIPKIPQSINFNFYEDDKNEYPYHRDASQHGSSYDIKLTAILNLSQDSYIGGEFDMFLGKDETLHDFNTAGALLVFPSFLFHRVRPVISGQRVTMSAWFKGPNFK